MSRRGKMPIALPKGIEVAVSGNKVTVKGAKGSEQIELRDGVEAQVADGQVVISATSEAAELKKFHGLYRALVQNAVTGLSEGYKKNLEIRGVGYRASVQGKQILMELGFSKNPKIDIPEGITVKVDDKVKIEISGSNAQRVGQFAANLRALRPPEPYKGKGVRYVGEYVRKKEGKTGKA